MVGFGLFMEFSASKRTPAVSSEKKKLRNGWFCIYSYSFFLPLSLSSHLRPGHDSSFCFSLYSYLQSQRLDVLGGGKPHRHLLYTRRGNEISSGNTASWVIWLQTDQLDRSSVDTFQTRILQWKLRCFLAIWVYASVSWHERITLSVLFTVK